MAVEQLTTHAEPETPAPHLLPLENGDRLTRAEFERRYEGMPNLKKAELVEGVVYVGSPVRMDVHAQPHASLVGWLALYSAATPSVALGDNATVRLDLDNEYQPDALLRIDESAGGRSHISTSGYVEGSPELVVEIAASSASIDRHAKLQVYRRSGVGEYLLWQTRDQRVDWFVLRDGEYVSLAPDAQGILRSAQFPGLTLAVPALLAGDLATVLATQQAALTTPEHQRFVETLATRRRT
jgi:Uma2 family endonuclease